MPKKKAIVKSFEEWRKKQGKVKKFKDITYEETQQVAEQLLTEEKISQLFLLVENIGQAEIKVKLAIEEFEKLTGKSLNVKTHLKLQNLKKLISGLQEDLLEEIQGG